MRRRMGTRVIVAGALLAGSVVATAGPAWAVDKEWTGGVDDRWSEDDNWTPTGVPGDGDVAVFPGPGETVVQDEAVPAGPTYRVAGLLFERNGYTITGSDPLGIDDSVRSTATSGLTTIAVPTQLRGPVEFDVNANTEVVVSRPMANYFNDTPTPDEGAVAKTGSGVLSLTATNTFTGDTTVEAGVLDLSGGVAGDMAVRSGGTLRTGSGDIGGLLEMEATSTFAVTLDGPTHDALNVADGVTLQGDGVALQVEIGPRGVTAGRAYTIVANSGPLTGTFAGLPEGATVTTTAGGPTFTITYEGGTTGADIVLTASGVPGEVIRLAGATRDLTGVEVSRNSFPVADSADAVVLARNNNFADALAGTPLALAVDGPLLITDPASLDPAVLAEIQRVLPAGGRVLVLGGTAAIAPGIVQALEAEGFVVERIGGATRYDTAVDIAGRLGAPSPLVVATGLDFADALSAGAAAAREGGAVLLTDGAVMPGATSAYLASRPGVPLFAAGGPAATAAGAGATPLVGADRYATAVLVAEAFFTAPPVVGVASGVNYPDALTGGANIARRGGPMLLTDPSTLSAETEAYVAATASVAGAVIFGGTAAVSDAVQAALAEVLA